MSINQLKLQNNRHQANCIPSFQIIKYFCYSSNIKLFTNASHIVHICSDIEGIQQIWRLFPIQLHHIQNSHETNQKAETFAVQLVHKPPPLHKIQTWPALSPLLGTSRHFKFNTTPESTEMITGLLHFSNSQCLCFSKLKSLYVRKIPALVTL